jgi:GNAT superfamily N-acetyltransferase
MSVDIERAQPDDAPVITELEGELLREIMATAGPVFGFDAAATERRARAWLAEGHSVIWLAKDEAEGHVVGFVALYEAYALYAEGAFGTISELFVRGSHRSQGVGRALLETVKHWAVDRRWTRLEVTTPPLPAFERTLSFYSRHGFSVSGGQKMKAVLK